MIGTQVSHYRLEEKLGEGTYGAVYRGVHIHDDELVVAVKVIHPNLATMLGFLATDVSAPPEALQALLKDVVARTFNAITVDGDTSTNDTVILQATGEGVAVAPGGTGWEALRQALLATCTDLARAIARDGEGATRLLEVRVDGLDDDAAAREAARAFMQKRTPVFEGH